MTFGFREGRRWLPQQGCSQTMLRRPGWLLITTYFNLVQTTALSHHQGNNFSTFAPNGDIVYSSKTSKYYSERTAFPNSQFSCLIHASFHQSCNQINSNSSLCPAQYSQAQTSVFVCKLMVLSQGQCRDLRNCCLRYFIQPIH